MFQSADLPGHIHLKREVDAYSSDGGYTSKMLKCEATRALFICGNLVNTPCNFLVKASNSVAPHT
jgi:hypothetical protein